MSTSVTDYEVTMRRDDWRDMAARAGFITTCDFADDGAPLRYMSGIRHGVNGRYRNICVEAEPADGADWAVVARIEDDPILWLEVPSRPGVPMGMNADSAAVLVLMVTNAIRSDGFMPLLSPHPECPEDYQDFAASLSGAVTGG